MKIVVDVVIVSDLENVLMTHTRHMRVPFKHLFLYYLF